MPIRLRIAAIFALSAVCAAVCAAVTPVAAREPVQAAPSASPGESVAAEDLFAAQAAGHVEVKYIPNDSRSAQVIVTNRTRKPLALRMPTAFAGVPVLAQLMGMGGGGGGAGFGAGGIGGGGGQATGGGFGQQGMNGMGGGGMGGMGGGAFSLPPQKTRVLRVTTVCLEHGKPEPSPRLSYKLVELDTFSSDPRLAAVLEQLGRGELSQKVAQAAAWHLANGLSWERIAAEKIDHAGPVPDEAYFTPAELLAAHRVVEQVSRTVDERQSSEAPVAGQ